MQVLREEMLNQLKLICQDMQIDMTLKDFQIDFFVNAVAGLNGFLRVNWYSRGIFKKEISLGSLRFWQEHVVPAPALCF